MQRKKMALVALALILCVGIVSAAVLPYFGRIVTTVDVKQAVLLDGQDYTTMPITETPTVAGGESFCRPHWLTSQTSVPVQLQFETTILPDATGVTVSYLKSTGYKDTVKTLAYGTTVYYPIDVIVEDIGSEIQWTFDFFAYNTTSMQGGGKFAGCVIVSLDGITPDFQIHNNDGICSAYGWGTWLYSPYDKTGGGWHGWHTSEAAWSTKVEDIGGIDATGNIYYVDNPEGKLVITIDKTKLNATFGWAVYASQFHFYAPNNGYSVYPEGFDWANIPFKSATILEPITSPFTLYSGERLDFYICYKFAVDIYPYIYTITTTVKPA